MECKRRATNSFFARSIFYHLNLSSSKSNVAISEIVTPLIQFQFHHCLLFNISGLPLFWGLSANSFLLLETLCYHDFNVNMIVRHTFQLVTTSRTCDCLFDDRIFCGREAKDFFFFCGRVHHSTRTKTEIFSYIYIIKSTTRIYTRISIKQY